MDENTPWLETDQYAPTPHLLLQYDSTIYCLKAHHCNLRVVGESVHCVVLLYYLPRSYYGTGLMNQGRVLAGGEQPNLTRDNTMARCVIPLATPDDGATDSITCQTKCRLRYHHPDIPAQVHGSGQLQIAHLTR